MAKQQTNRPNTPNAPKTPTGGQIAQTQRTAPVRPSEKKENIFSEGKSDFIFGRAHFILFGIGLALVLGGLALMTGGQQSGPNVWDETVVYSPMRITVAPMMILAGFVTVIIGIFKKA